MHTTRVRFAAAIACMLFFGAASAGAAEDDSQGRSIDTAPWSRWQGRVSFGNKVPPSRGGLTYIDSGSSLAPSRSVGIDGLSLMGDYYFGRAFASETGGFRATSGLVIGPRSQISIAQPNLATGNVFGAGNRLFGQPAGLRAGLGGDAPGDSTAALPYVGLGYSGRTASGALSFSADFGIVGQLFGDSSMRPFGVTQRGGEDYGRDRNRSPLLQLGVLYSF